MSINAEVNGVGLFPLVLFQSFADCVILENIQRVFVFEPPPGNSSFGFRDLLPVGISNGFYLEPHVIHLITQYLKALLEV